VTVSEILLLQVGRHFRLAEDQHLALGRRDEENQKLLELRRDGDILLKLHGIPGPLGLLRGRDDEKGVRAAASIVVRYSKAREKPAAEVEVTRIPGIDGRLTVAPASDEEIRFFRF